MSEEKVRLFVGARISMATVRGLAGAVEALRGSDVVGDTRIKWVAPPSYHVTLKFIGWSRPEVIYAIRDEVEVALRGLGGTDFEVRGAGAFPSAERARVLWAGVSEPGALTEAATRVDAALEPLGIPAEKRAFHPHVTLGRIKGGGNVSGIVDALAEQVYRNNRLDSVVLYESVMKSTGSEYAIRATWQLESSSKRSRRQTPPVKQTAQDDTRRAKPIGPEPSPSDTEEQNDGEQGEQGTS